MKLHQGLSLVLQGLSIRCINGDIVFAGLIIAWIKLLHSLITDSNILWSLVCGGLAIGCIKGRELLQGLIIDSNILWRMVCDGLIISCITWKWIMRGVITDNNKGTVGFDDPTIRDITRGSWVFDGLVFTGFIVLERAWLSPYVVLVINDNLYGLICALSYIHSVGP